MMDLYGTTILAIDGDVELLRWLELVFDRANARPFTAIDGLAGLRQFDARRPDLVLLDPVLPGMDGWEVCRRIRQISHVPVIMFTSLWSKRDIVRGLGCGADDYIVKPVNLEILLARVRALLRRTRLSSAMRASDIYADGYLKIDLGWQWVSVCEARVQLSAVEFRLLAFLFRHAGQTLTCEQILEHVWGDKGRAAYVHIYISYLRAKLEPDPKRPCYLLSERGQAYRFQKA